MVRTSVNSRRAARRGDVRHSPAARKSLIVRTPPSLDRYPFTLPSVSPEMSHLDEYRNRAITGIDTRIDAAENSPH